MKNKNFKNISYIAILSLLFLLFFLGTSFLNPSNTKWLTTLDLISYQDAWNFFKNDDWRFPIGKLPNYGIDIGNSIVYADIIPIFAIIFKIFKNFLPENFQYYSIWIYLCIFFQSYISFLIFQKFTKSAYFSILSSIFFILSPVFLNRLGVHIALASHWTILFAFYIETLDKKKDALRNINILLSIFIHFSLTIIVFILHYIFKIDELFLKKKKIKFFKDTIFLAIICIIAMYLLGYFEIPPQDGLGGGYGYFAFNLNSFFNPLNSINNLNNSWSLFLPILDQPRGHHEGFAYLGLSGVIFLFLFLLSIFIRNNSGFFYNKKKIFLIIFFFFLLAISHEVYFSDKLIFALPINKYFYGVLGLIRASGRMIWPIYYLIFFTGIIFIFRNFSSNKRNIIITFLLLVQIADLAPGLKKFYNGKIYNVNSQLTDKIWDVLPNHYEIVKVLERKNNSELYKMIPDYFGRSGFKKTDIFNAARLDRVKLKEGSYLTTKEFINEKIENKSFFLTIYNQHLLVMKSIYGKNPNYNFYFRDGIWILADKLIDKKNYFEKKKFEELYPETLNTDIKTKFKYSLDGGYQGIGWTLKNNKMLTDGYIASIIFSIDNNTCNNEKKLNIYFDLDKILHNQKLNFPIKIFINKTFYNQIDLKKITKNFFTIKLDCKDEIFFIHFDIKNPTSEREKNSHLNASKLGFEIKYLELKN